MKNNRITFIGTSSHKSARTTKNGECLRIVNLRQKNGCITSVKNHSIDSILTEANRVLLYVHSCNGQQHYISQCEGTLYHESDVTTQNNTNSVKYINKSIITLDEDLSSITSLGTTLIVTTASKIYYLLHQESGYKLLGNKPPMPIIRFNHKYKEKGFKTIEETVFSGEIKLSNTNLLNEFTNTMLGTYYKLRDETYEKFYFIQPYMIRYALRLYDGSHIMPSAPILIRNSGYDEHGKTRKAYFSYDEIERRTTMSEYLMTFNIYGLEYTIDYCPLEEWRDIVTGIDVFVSKEITLTEDRCIDNGVIEELATNTIAYQFTFPILKSASIEKSAREETLFYKLFSIDLDSIEIGTTTEAKYDVRPDNIIYQPRLKVDTFGFEEIGALKSYVYNGRLHLGNITHRYFEGFPLTLFTQYKNTDNTYNALAYIRTTINHPNGSRKEVVAYTSIPYFDFKLTSMLSFPDSNATSMQIGIRYNGIEYSKTFALTGVDNENRASYIEPLMQDINVQDWDSVEVTTSNLEDFPTASKTFSYQNRNEMIVSELNNPFYIPTEQSYNISNGNIVGMGTTTIALSQGQYGEFPLYVFTDEGIWSMRQGTGEFSYTNCTLINNASVDGRTPIITTEKNILYRSGKNLYILNGSESRVILSLTEFSQQNFCSLIPSIVKSGKQAHTDNTSLPDYLEGNICIGYLQDHNELIFCNPAYNYYLVVHLSSGHIYRKESSIRCLVHGGNKLLAQSHNNAIYDLAKEIESASAICLVTHPIQPEPDTYTRLKQIALRMSCSNANLTIKVLAAHEPDGTYGNIYTATYDGTIAGHLPIKLYASAYKYYRIVIYGSVSNDFILDCADMAFEPAKNNKLR